MMEVPGIVRFLCVLVAASGVLGHVENQEVTRVSDTLPPIHFEPQVAFLCNEGQSYHPQYMSDQGRWTTDPESKVSCLKDKVDVLTYCKKMYPKRDITNIVEASHSVKVTGWCRIGHKKCKHPAMVKPFRCLEGPFQSDALLVPESCLFDHVHNQTRCWEFGRWNETAAQSCADRDMQLRSFAMLLPCGISVFAGVEFVCCPKNDPMKGVKMPVDMAPLPSSTKEETADGPFDASDDASSAALDASEDDDDDEDLDDEEQDAALPEPVDNVDNQGDSDDDSEDSEEYTDEDTGAGNGSDDNKVTPSTTRSPGSSAAPQPSAMAPVPPAQPRNTPSPTPSPTPDPYFLHFDPRREHQDYKQAQHRLEETHREKVTKVMKDWSDLEERYQEMRNLDPKGALDFKKRMTLRFQKTVQSLEEEGDAEKHQLVAMHQQRVLAHINQRKKEAMTCYTTALNDSPPNTHRVQKCLQKLLRALHKDRHHTIAHYRHLLASSYEQAEREKPITLEHLTDIDRMVNQSLQMLQRFPSLQDKIGQLMEDYIQALRSKDDTPGSLLTMTRAAEAAILDKYHADITAQLEEKERQRALERQRKEQRKKERVELREEKMRVEAAFGKTLAKESKFDPETMEDEHEDSDSSNQEDLPMVSSSSNNNNIVSSSSASTTSSTAAPPAPAMPAEREHTREREHEREHDRPTPPAPELAVLSHKEEGPKVAHAQTHDVSHGEPTFSLRRDYRRESKGVYFTLAFAGIALMAAVVVGIALLRRRSARLPQNQGFVEVDQAATPEERHVANMQINGYENPTYKYFEVKE